MVKKKIYYLYIVIFILYGIGMFYTGKLFYFIGYLIILAIIKYFSIRREKELQKMWELAEQNNLTIEKLSELSGLGRLDLKATKYEEPGKYYPPRKVIKQTIEKIEELDIKRQAIQG